jgi:hypothetical protein
MCAIYVTIRYAKPRYFLHRPSVTIIVATCPANIPLGRSNPQLPLRRFFSTDLAELRRGRKQPRLSKRFDDAPEAPSPGGKIAGSAPGSCRHPDWLPSGPSALSSRLAHGALVSRTRRRSREVRHTVRRKASDYRLRVSRRFFFIWSRGRCPTFSTSNRRRYAHRLLSARSRRDSCRRESGRCSGASGSRP